MKTLYNSFVRSHLDYASVSCVELVQLRAFEKNRGYPEEIFEIRVVSLTVPLFYLR
jgi:hypothetical protein